MAPQVRNRVSSKKMVDITNGKKVEICPSVKIAREEQSCDKMGSVSRADKTKHANTITPFYPMKSPGRRRGLSTIALHPCAPHTLAICRPRNIPQTRERRENRAPHLF